MPTLLTIPIIRDTITDTGTAIMMECMAEVITTTPITITATITPAIIMVPESVTDQMFLLQEPALQ